MMQVHRVLCSTPLVLCGLMSVLALAADLGGPAHAAQGQNDCGLLSADVSHGEALPGNRMA